MIQTRLYSVHSQTRSTIKLDNLTSDPILLFLFEIQARVPDVDVDWDAGQRFDCALLLLRQLPRVQIPDGYFPTSRRQHCRSFVCLLLSSRAVSMKRTRVIKKRTIFTEEQKNILANHYKNDKKPSQGAIKVLSQMTNQTVKTVRIWFQNQRQREREVTNANTEPSDSDGAGDLDLLSFTDDVEAETRSSDESNEQENREWHSLSPEVVESVNLEISTLSLYFICVMGMEKEAADAMSFDVLIKMTSEQSRALCNSIFQLLCAIFYLKMFCTAMAPQFLALMT